MRDSTSRCFAIAIALAATSAGGSASGNLVSGAGQAPPGANDIEVQFSDTTGIPNSHIIHSGTTIDGNPTPTLGSGTAGMSTWDGSMTAGAVYGWSLESSETLTILDWYFTTDGNQVGLTMKSPTAMICPAAGPAGAFSLSVTSPDPSTSMAITNFQVFVSQSPSLENDVLGFADFSTSPFTGSAVSGIPTSFTLDSSDPTVMLSPSSYSGLVTDPNTLVFIQGTVNGTSMFRYECSVCPEPSTISMFGIGLASVVFALRRPFRVAKSRSTDFDPKR